jgi:iron complex transport system substrate-binding protein
LRPDLARIIAAKPDLIFSGLYTYNKDALESIRSMKLPLMQFPLLTLHDLRQAAKSIANALDTPQSAQSFQKRLDTAIKGAKAQRPDKAPRVLLVYATDAGYIFTTGGGDLLSEIVVLVGGKNAAEGGPATRRLSLGQVLALSPDMIVHVASDRRFKHDRHARDYWRKVGTFPAVVHNRIYVWTDDRLSRMGPQVPDAIKKMAHLVQGDAS